VTKSQGKETKGYKGYTLQSPRVKFNAKQTNSRSFICLHVAISLETKNIDTALKLQYLPTLTTSLIKETWVNGFKKIKIRGSDDNNIDLFHRGFGR